VGPIHYFPEVGGATSYVVGSRDFFDRKFTPMKVKLQDTRGREADFSLEKQRFQWITHASEQGDFGDDACTYPKPLLCRDGGPHPACVSVFQNRYFASEMRPNEVLLITIFDTNKTAEGINFHAEWFTRHSPTRADKRHRQGRASSSGRWLHGKIRRLKSPR